MSTSTLASWSTTAALLATFALGGPGQRPGPQVSGLTTFYAHDDLACALDLRTGNPGGRVFDGEIHLENAQIAYDVFERGRLTVGFVHDERVSVLDLGEITIPPQNRTSDQAIEFPLALFHTLEVDGPRFFYRGPGGARHEFDDADRLLTTLPPPGLVHLEPQVGHTYVLRARRGRGADDLFKFHVVAHRPGESVTLRWAQLPGR